MREVNQRKANSMRELSKNLICLKAGKDQKFVWRVRGTSWQLFCAENLFSDVGAEILGEVIQQSGFHLRSPVPRRLTEPALLRWIIRIGQPRFQSIARQFGPVEAIASRISFGDERPCYRVSRATEKASLPHGVITGVLVRDRRHDSLGEKGSRHSVRECAPIIAAVTGGSVT